AGAVPHAPGEAAGGPARASREAARRGGAVVTALDRLAADALAAARARRRTPGATYRLQFHAGFTLRDALALVPYFHALGVTHLYASPLLTARPGSTHGYDILDHDRLNPEIGTEADLAALAAALRARGM